MTDTPVLSLIVDESDAGYAIRRFLSAAVASAHRDGLLQDYCSTAGRVMRRLELMADGKVRMLPD